MGERGHYGLVSSIDFFHSPSVAILWAYHFFLITFAPLGLFLSLSSLIILFCLFVCLSLLLPVSLAPTSPYRSLPCSFCAWSWGCYSLPITFLTYYCVFFAWFSLLPAVFSLRSLLVHLLPAGLLSWAGVPYYLMWLLPLFPPGFLMLALPSSAPPSYSSPLRLYPRCRTNRLWPLFFSLHIALLPILLRLALLRFHLSASNLVLRILQAFGRNFR